jgi:ribonuclease E
MRGTELAKKTTKKKTTTKKTIKRTTKRTTRKKTTAKDAAADDVATPPTNSDVTVKSAADEKSTAKKARRKKATKSTRKEKAPRSKSTRKAAPRAAQAETTTAQVEEQDDAIVIRFPPVAPSPFADIGLPERAAPPKAPAIAVPAEDDDNDESEFAAPAVAAPEPEVDETPEVEDAPAVSVGSDDDDERDADGGPMTRSQKRRQRRRRRRRKEPGEEAAATAPVADADDAVSAFAEDEDDLADDYDEPAAAVAEVDEEATPDWLDDEELAEAEVIEPEDAEPETILPDEEDTVEEPLDDDFEEDLEDDIEEAISEDEEEDEDEDEEDDGAVADERREGRPRRRRRRGRRSSRHERPGVAAEIEPEEGGGRTIGKREMIINTIHREECRIAILNEKRLEEIYLERAANENHVGNIYKGIVTNVEPSIQAAFVDFGQGKNGFLHISDLHPDYFPEGSRYTENVGRKMPRRSRPPIQKCLRRGQQVQVQVTKEGIGTKGPTLSTYLSIPGRFLVMMPGMGRLGVSRRIEDPEARSKLRAALGELELPGGMGFIARTAALERTQRELQSDLGYLTRLWRAVEKRRKSDPAPAELYRESDLVIRTIRDVFTADVERIVIDDLDVARRAREFLSIFSPRSRDIVVEYTDPEPLFHKYGIEAELERLHSRHVPLASGGSLVIDQTEALVAIDVNSGRFRTEDDAETTAYKINCEAADEIPRQLRLRDLGGVVVCDFIDMRLEKHRRSIERRLIENLKKHKERAKVLRTSAFGLIELTRQRQRASLTRSVYRDCRHCGGTGLVKTVESVVLDVMRLVQLAVTREHIHMVEVAVSPEVAYLLQNRKRKLICDLEVTYKRIISIRPSPSFSSDQLEITCTDARGRVVPHT